MSTVPPGPYAPGAQAARAQYPAAPTAPVEPSAPAAPALGGAASGLPEGFVFPGTEQVNPFEVFATPGYQSPQPRTDPVAFAALVFALLSFFPGIGLVAAGFGAWALHRLRRSWASGEAMAWLAVVVGTATSVAFLWLWGIVILVP